MRVMIAALVIGYAANLRAEEAKNSYTHGVAKEQKGDLAGAVADYTKAIEVNPKYKQAYYRRGIVENLQGSREAAIADLTHAIELDPKYADAYRERSDVLAKTRQYDDALKDIQTAIELEPKKGGDYSSLAWYELLERHPREAIAASLKALELSPKNAAMIKTNLAHGYLFDNQFEKAKDIYSKNRDAKLLDDQRTFREAVLDDFREFEEAGITHPNMEKIKALLETQYLSPDGNFALRVKDQKAELIEEASGRVVVDLGEPWRRQVLVWSPDSKRVAYGNRGEKAGEVSVYFWNGSNFEQASLPEDLPSPDIKLPKGCGAVKNYGGAATPLRWSKSGDLELSSDLMMLCRESGATCTAEVRFTLAFDAQHHASVKQLGKTKTEVEK